MLVDNDLAAGELMNRLDKYPVITFDVETSGLELYKQDRIVGVALGIDGREGWYLPFRHGEGANLSQETFIKLSRCLRGKTFIAFNAKFDVTAWRREGFESPDTIIDPMLAAHLMNESETSYALKNLSDKYLGGDSSAAEAELKQILRDAGYGAKGDKGQMWKLPAAKVARYAVDDVLLTHRLGEGYQPHLERWGLNDLYKKLCQFELVLQRLEWNGLQLDVAHTRELFAEALLQAGIAREQMAEMSGNKDLNPNSSKQLQEWLELKSTAKKIIEKLADGRDDIAMLLDFRGWGKVASTYYSTFLERMDASGVLHPNLHMIRTPARLSASDPNLQAIPRLLDDGDPRAKIYKVKEAFVARPGKTLIELDFSQAEVRMAAWVSGDKALKAAMMSGTDLYSGIAKTAGISRQDAKTVTLAKIYRAGIARLTEQLNSKRKEKISAAEVKAIVAQFDATYPELTLYAKKIEYSARKRGYIRTWLGRIRRYTPEAIPDDHPSLNYKQSRARPFRAFNNICQISAAEMTMEAMIRIDRELQGEAKIQLSVHDSFLVEADERNAIDIAHRCKEIMQIPPPGCDVPIVADVKIGKRWSVLEKLQ